MYDQLELHFPLPPKIALPDDSVLRDAIRPGEFHSSHGFVFIWKSGPPELIAPNAVPSATDGMRAVICGWARVGIPQEIFSHHHQSLN
jgi:hypothetical protein